MHIQFFSTLVGSAAIWLLVASCGTSGTSTGGAGGGGGGGTSSSPEDKEIDAFCDAILPPFCGALFECCTDKVAQTERLNAGATPEECVARWKDSWCLHDLTASSLKASLRAGTTILDHAKLDECIAQFKSMSAGGTACITPPAFLMLYSCFGAFRGQIAPGEACNWGVENDSFMQCKNGRCEQGTCVSFLKTGDTCSIGKSVQSVLDPPAKICNYVEREWCRGSGDTGTCGPLGKVGDACGGTGYVNHYACMSHFCGDTGECRPMLQDQQACEIY